MVALEWGWSPNLGSERTSRGGLLDRAKSCWLCPERSVVCIGWMPERAKALGGWILVIRFRTELLVAPRTASTREPWMPLI